MTTHPLTEASEALLARVWPTDPLRCPIADGGEHVTYGGICHCGWTWGDKNPGRSRVPTPEGARDHLAAIERDAVARVMPVGFTADAWASYETRLGEERLARAEADAEVARLKAALRGMVRKWGSHSGACCTFDADGTLVVTRGSCVCDEPERAAHEALVHYGSVAEMRAALGGRP